MKASLIFFSLIANAIAQNTCPGNVNVDVNGVCCQSTYKLDSYGLCCPSTACPAGIQQDGMGLCCTSTQTTVNGVCTDPIAPQAIVIQQPTCPEYYEMTNYGCKACCPNAAPQDKNEECCLPGQTIDAEGLCCGAEDNSITPPFQCPAQTTQSGTSCVYLTSNNSNSNSNVAPTTIAPSSGNSNNPPLTTQITNSSHSAINSTMVNSTSNSSITNSTFNTTSNTTVFTSTTPVGQFSNNSLNSVNHASATISIKTIAFTVIGSIVLIVLW